MGIEKLNMKIVDIYKRNSVESLISISFFRIPQFREKFLSVILEKGNIVIDEWRNTDGVSLEDGDVSDNNPSVMRLFDWKSFFYDVIPQEVYDQNIEILQRLLSTDKWKMRISKRGVAYFLIVKQWAEYVKRALVRNMVNWMNVPGYRQILKSILIEMKTREVGYYPEALKDATCALLANEKLLNVFVAITFSKTQAYDNNAVNTCMELTAQWFNVIHKNKLIVPPSFDFQFFLKAIDILLNLDHGTSTAKCLWMLYKILHIIPLNQRSILLKKLLKSTKFYELMFHWSWNVRTIFLYLYNFQFYHNYNQESGGGGPEKKITEEKKSNPSKTVMASKYFGIPGG